MHHETLCQSKQNLKDKEEREEEERRRGRREEERKEGENGNRFSRQKHVLGNHKDPSLNPQQTVKT